MTTSILIVEDNPDNMKLVTWTLEDAGYGFQGVGSAEEGLAALAQCPFDLVLMDVSLPGIDGKEATRRIRANERWKRLPVIALTAHAVQGEAEAIFASGVTAHLTKPIDEELLLQVIRECLDECLEQREADADANPGCR
jgi:CheY-like chemotaxis protein